MAQSRIKHIGNGVFVDTDPVAPPNDEGGDENFAVYAYAEMHSLERVSYGLILTSGKIEDEIETKKVGGYGMEPIAQFHDYSSAVDGTRHKYAFEEVPYVEVEREEDYEELLDLLKLDESGWEGPGLYDFRDSPPSFQGSVEDYELEEMEGAADLAIEFMFQGEEWQDAYRELVEDEFGTDNDDEED